MLRRLGGLALERQGYAIESKVKSGVAPGALLIGRRGSEVRDFAVRACPLRKIQAVRFARGSWKTLPDVDDVVAVAPELIDPSAVEVFGFDAKVVVVAFDSALADLEQRGKRPRPSEPVFVSLDDRYSRARETKINGLKSKAKWSTVLRFSLAEEARPGPGSPSHQVMNDADHELLDHYLSTILNSFKLDKIDEKTATADIAEAIAKLNNEGLESMKSYLRATLRDEKDNP